MIAVIKIEARRKEVKAVELASVKWDGGWADSSSESSLNLFLSSSFANIFCFSRWLKIDFTTTATHQWSWARFYYEAWTKQKPKLRSDVKGDEIRAQRRIEHLCALRLFHPMLSNKVLLLMYRFSKVSAEITRRFASADWTLCNSFCRYCFLISINLLTTHASRHFKTEFLPENQIFISTTTFGFHEWNFPM